MLKKIKTRELKIGMYVVFPPSLWLRHPFLRNSFMIHSESDLRKLNESGIDELTIDTSRGLYVRQVEETTHWDRNLPPPSKWTPELLVPDELREAVRNKNLGPSQKAKIVYSSSVTLMGKLFSNPVAENIRIAKDAIAEVVDLIISDNETARHLLSITSYDFYTYTHSVNVGVLSVMLSKALFKKSDAHDLHELGAGFFLHDLGKVRIDEKIINKAGRLDPDEIMKVRSHPYQGYKLLAESEHLSEEVMVIVMQHHERVDGTGYPRRLKQEDIHLYARICCIADVYDALTAERSYKKNIPPFDALTIMKDEMIGHFSPEVFKEFVLLFT